MQYDITYIRINHTKQECAHTVYVYIYNEDGTVFHWR